MTDMTNAQTIYGRLIDDPGCFPEYEEFFLGTEAPEGFEVIFSESALCDRDAIEWVEENLQPGMLVRTQAGVHMVDANLWLMKAGYHDRDPERAAKLAGLQPKQAKKVIAPVKR